MTNFDKLKEQWKLDGTQSFDSQICDIIRKMRGIKNYQHTWECGSCKECSKWLQQEYKEPILDDVEKKYLSAVIKPFKDIVEYIEKMCIDEGLEGICISINCLYGDVFLPPFVIGTMYTGMKIGKKYTLEELGL